MKTRHRAREIALQILYQYDLSTQSAAPVSPIKPVTPIASPGRDIRLTLNHHFQHFAVPEELREFITQLVTGTLERIPTLDETLEKHASNWKVARMSSVDRSLLRMATYEMIHLKDTPASVVIDEAIELAKQFGTEDSPSFINGLLDSIRVAEAAPSA